MSFQKVCNLEDIDNGCARGFEIEISQKSISVICIRQGEKLSAYKNSCPHTGVNLEWLPDQFLDDTQQYLVCSTHGALFQIDDGYCVSGPCLGDSLHSLTVKQQENECYIDISSCDAAVKN